MFARRTFMAAAAFGAAALIGGVASAENLTDESRQLLKDAGLDESYLKGLDKELNVPQAWVDGAKKEGRVRVQLTMSARQFHRTSALFKARYPGIELEYTRGIGAPTQKVLVAYKAGNVIMDAIATYDSRVHQFREAGMANVTGLPAYAGLRDEMKTPEGTDAADKMNYWCMMYSAKRVKKADLPKTWDDLLTMKRWRNGRVAVASNTGQTLLPTLAFRNGDAWYDNFLAKLFGEVKPQLRKETLAAVGKLISVGEYDVAFGMQAYLSKRDQVRGMPVKAHCPEPIAVTWGKLGILAKSPNMNAAKLYVNWHISKEGQIANYQYGLQVPVHRELASKEFLPFPEEVLGKKQFYRTDEVIDVQRKYIRRWIQAWQGAGGPDLSRGRGKKRGGPK